MTSPAALQSPSDSPTRAAHEEDRDAPMRHTNHVETSSPTQPARDLESGSYTEMERESSTMRRGAHMDLTIFCSVQEEFGDAVP